MVRTLHQGLDDVPAVEGQCLGDDPVVLVPDPRHLDPGNGIIIILGRVDNPKGAEQEPLPLASLVFLLDVDQGLEPAQIVGIAKHVLDHVVLIVGLPVVMHHNARQPRQQAAAAFIDPEGGQERLADHVKPACASTDAKAGLVRDAWPRPRSACPGRP